MKMHFFQNGDTFPSLGLGTYLSKKNEVYNAVVEAIKIGYRHFDCAYIYQNEAEIGEALQFVIKTKLVKREELFITSKLWNSDHDPERVVAAAKKSLEDLQLDYLDLYLIHWPVAFKTGHEQATSAADLQSLESMPIAETWKAMEHIKEMGLTKHIGVSNFNIPKLKNLIENSSQKPEVNQIELHPYFQQAELVEFCQSQNILTTAYSPLGSRHLINSKVGITTKKTIIQIAQKHNCTASQVLLAWGIERNTIVIPKSTNPQRLQENFDAIKVRLDEKDMIEIKQLERNFRLAKGQYCVLPGGYYTLENIWET